MSLKQRIRKLEDRLGSEEAQTFTWEQLDQVEHYLNEQLSNPRAQPSARMERLARRVARVLQAEEVSARQADQADPEPGHGRCQPSPQEPQDPAAAKS